MFNKKTIRVNRAYYESLIDTTDALKRLCSEKDHKASEVITALERENECFKAFFDKEADTKVIKYNGKPYRIVSTQHYKDGCEESLDINLVPVSEVG